METDTFSPKILLTALTAPVGVPVSSTSTISRGLPPSTPPFALISSNAIVKAREIGTDEGKKLFGLTLSQEKAILLILTPVSGKQPILKAICETVLQETGEHAVAFSMPVDEVQGISG